MPNQKLKPELQIIHISDWHYRDPDFKEDHWLAVLLDTFRKSDRFINYMNATNGKKPALAWLQGRLLGLEDGMAGHSEHAIAAFRKFISMATVEDDDWKNEKTWLIDTGDLTTYGDNPSLHKGHALLADFAARAGKVEYYNIHGNHDAWPNTQPLLAKTATIEAHKKELRKNYFVNQAPEPKLHHAMTSGDAIDLYWLNSVLHGRVYNGMALGEIQHDKYWDVPPHRIVRGRQMDLLRNDASANLSDAANRNLRIVLSHHPIRTPAHFNYDKTMRLLNASEVLEGLSASEASPELGKLCHLILSGHTHELHPAVGELRSSNAKDQPLQLVIGSLMKNYTGSPGGDVEYEHARFNQLYYHQCQVLRFYADADRPGEVKMERLVAARGNGAGPFRLVPWGEKRAVESIVLNY